jgi:hypothetical protein
MKSESKISLSLHKSFEIKSRFKVATTILDSFQSCSLKNISKPILPCSTGDFGFFIWLMGRERHSDINQDELLSGGFAKQHSATKRRTGDKMVKHQRLASAKYTFMLIFSLENERMAPGAEIFKKREYKHEKSGLELLSLNFKESPRAESNKLKYNE